MAENFFEIKDLTVKYHSGNSIIHAVNDVSIVLNEGETLGLVGETGAGKTTIAKSVLRILPENSVESLEGSILYNGENILEMEDKKLQSLRGKSISMIFQDPMTALNPVKTVISQISEGYKLHHNCSRAEADKRAIEMLELVGISADRAEQFPHQFSGGMKQRVVIALALACSPKLLLADEPTTALDVTIQAQVLDLIKDLKNKFNTAMILITHDLGVVAQVCDKVAVIYAGRIVESGTLADVYDNPSHPYTRGLFAALPDLDNDVERLSPIEGLPPDPSEIRDGCDFKERCPYKCHGCDRYDNEMIEVTPGHFTRCWRCNKGE
ncbi:MAG: ABC transporter ATP-binding protein [Pseudobutyrivibrio ruminis]|uniref:ABC transporter ATP-binding protein n=1 Tax=Pseudobutyrivibrio ruminis TaxID=46206 RepID=UPI0026EF0F5A|nr:ABC transporter ATP-binding protein [Pseudobutyrivibrio ruminis]MBE5912646.1 ABC transporter ATP-binding protein [Pseudobutyrivibrio ruminis]